MRVVVDGNDNLHLLYHDEGPQKFYPGTEKDNWEDDRMIYIRKTATGTWESPQRWKGADADEGGLGGDMYVDANGDVHFVLVAGSSKTWKKSLERRSISKSGSWGAKVRYASFPVGTGMYEMFGGQISPRGWLYLAGISSKPSGLAVWVFNNQQGTAPTSLFNHTIHTRAGVDLLLDPSGNGDIWVAVGNWQVTAGNEDYQRGFYYHYDASIDRWSAKTQLSSPTAANVETFWDTTPKLRAYRGRVYLFYSEKARGEKAKFYLRAFGKPPVAAGDAGVRADAGQTPDAGGGPDTGHAVDAGSDASAGFDAGTGPDSGVGPDVDGQPDAHGEWPAGVDAATDRPGSGLRGDAGCHVDGVGGGATPAWAAALALLALLTLCRRRRGVSRRRSGSLPRCGPPTG
jgi:hypothetical protein